MKINRSIKKILGILLVSFVVGWLCFIYKAGGAKWSEVIYSIAGPWIIGVTFLLLWVYLGKRNQKGES